MNYIILDLEWNTSYSKRYHKFVNEIIEFGAVKTDDSLQVIDTFSMLIKPQIGKKINERTIKLTHITNDELLESKNTFTHVMSKFAKFLGDGVLLTWSTSDLLALIDNNKYYLSIDNLPFLTKYCNLQKYCEKHLGIYDPAKQIGLAKCAEMLQIKQTGIELHRAFNDAMLSFECFKKTYNRDQLQKRTEIATSPEFYRKLCFKVSYITDISSPLIDKKELYFNCNQCQTKARQRSIWELKNKCFRANFKCPKCQNEFLGRISFKRKYDSIAINKKIIQSRSE